MRLTKGMYGTEFRNTDCPLFGIKCGQMRGDPISSDSGWYNQLGEKLGWGDLSPEDFQRISEQLELDEIFIILSKQDSFWKFVEHIGIIGSLSKTTPTAEAPGIDYVSEHAIYIISPGKCYRVDRLGSYQGDFVRSGITFGVLDPNAAKEFIKAVASL